MGDIVDHVLLVDTPFVTLRSISKPDSDVTWRQKDSNAPGERRGVSKRRTSPPYSPNDPIDLS